MDTTEAGKCERRLSKPYVGGISGNRDELNDKIKDLPSSPGIYAFRDTGGEILYVGKARNLRNRVRSYFGSNLTAKTEALMTRVAACPRPLLLIQRQRL